LSIKYEDITESLNLIRVAIPKTPCWRSPVLSDITGTEIILKYENKQFTGSFKDRGALVKLLSLSKEDKEIGVIAMSAGNHAQAVAYHSHRLGIPATIVMPKFTPNVKVSKTRSYGAEVILHGADFTEASEHTKQLVSERGLILIHPYDDEEIIKGQGTIALEMLDDFPDIDVFIIPVGGGGLISGNSIAAKAINKNIEIYGVQTENFPSMYQALRGEKVVCGSNTIADGIAVKKPGVITLPIIREFVKEIILVGEKEIEESVLVYLESESSVVEGAGAAGLAAVMSDKNHFTGKKVGLIISGGNIDLLPLSSIIQRGLARSKRLARLKIIIPDVPGSLSDITELLGNYNANIIEVRHQRAFTNLSLRSAEVEFVIQTLGCEHLKEVVDAIKNSNYEVIAEDQDIY